MLRKCQSSGNVEWLCGESVEELLFFFFQICRFKQTRGVQYRGTPLVELQRIFGILDCNPAQGGGGGDIFKSPITRLKIFQNPFLGEPGERGKVGNGVYLERCANSE